MREIVRNTCQQIVNFSLKKSMLEINEDFSSLIQWVLAGVEQITTQMRHFWGNWTIVWSKTCDGNKLYKKEGSQLSGHC